MIYKFEPYCKSVKNREMKLLNSVKNIRLVLALIFVSIFSIFPISSAQSDSPPAKKKAFTIVIDPGHGGNKPGARGRRSVEKDLVLDVSKKLKLALQTRLENVNVIMTRTTDVDVDFWKRTDIANKAHADIFISIHANSAKSSSAKGTETLVLGFHRINEQDAAIRENADMLLEENYEENYKELGNFDPQDPSTYIVFKLLKRQFRAQSIKLASLMQTEYTKSNRINRGVKEQGLAVLSKAGMPAVLTEIGFINNREEENFMLSDAGQRQIVENLR
jgi:N-acetylmuramoyl-L-alanine amidase